MSERRATMPHTGIATFAKARRRGNLVFTNEVFDLGPAGVLDRLPDALGKYYMSIDIDALDPSIAPETESPEAEGLSYAQLKRILRGLAPRGRMVGLDLVEVNPYLDHAELTQHMAAQVLISLERAGRGGRQYSSSFAELIRVSLTFPPCAS